MIDSCLIIFCWETEFQKNHQNSSVDKVDGLYDKLFIVDVVYVHYCLGRNIISDDTCLTNAHRMVENMNCPYLP